MLWEKQSRRTRICTQISKTSTPPVLSLRLVCSTTNSVYYRSQQSCGKAMLLHLSVILSTRGLCPKGLCPGGFCPGGFCPGVLDPGRVSVQGVSVQEDLPAATVQLRAGGTHPTGMHSYSVLLLFRVFSQLLFGVNCCPWWAIVSKLKNKNKKRIFWGFITLRKSFIDMIREMRIDKKNWDLLVLLKF